MITVCNETLRPCFVHGLGDEFVKGKGAFHTPLPPPLSKSIPKSINQTQPKHLRIEITLRTSLHPEKKTATKFLKSNMGIDRKA